MTGRAALALPRVTLGPTVDGMSLPPAVTSALDTALDKSVLLGYSSIGVAMRRTWWPSDASPDALVGRHVIVTGGSGGLGEATAVGLARLGAIVHLVGRTASRLTEAADRIRAQVPGATLAEDVCDVGDLDAVRAYAARLRDDLGALHGIVHCAGLMPPERSESPQGHETTLATHVLGPLLLTEELRPLLASSEGARVVVVSSGGMYSAPLDEKIGEDVEYTRGEYDGVRAYARTKRLQVVLAEELAGRYAGEGITVHSMHPGWADTPGVTDSLPRFAKVAKPILRTAEQGADTIVWLVAADPPGRTTGLFWSDRRPRPTAYGPWLADDPSQRARAWAYCVAAVGLGGA